jgi:uncharacterized protein (TIGR00299 family) protein
MPERVLFLESVAGIAGDMFTAAFLDAGLVTPDEIQAVPEQLGSAEVHVDITASERAGAMATHVEVVLPQGHDESGHRHYHYPALVRQIEGSTLEEGAKSFALQVFRFLAEAEAEAHGVTLEKVAFHEVGAVDSVVDVAMAAVCVQRVGAERVLASPVKLGRGTIQIEHGVHPVPPPASARLAVGMPVDPVPEAITRKNVELSTPTGLAILKALDPEFVVGWPGGTLLAQGSGAGTMELGDFPNVFRVAHLEGVLVGGADSVDIVDLPYESDQVVEIRCNVDDQTGERTAWLMEKAMAIGALDAWVVPIVGKKGRPAAEMTLLASPDQRDELADFLLRSSTTFGVRFSTWDRLKLAREEEVRDTPRGPVSFKVGRTTDGETLKEKPEFEDLRKIWEDDPGFKP